LGGPVLGNALMWKAVFVDMGGGLMALANGL